ncbi:MAG: hypothetical protein AVO35_05655 [Candidatus Aegiribacteria sp. MLS_C]|nr:MAG: hypothetical protein AVO35_05655 [Candidatus Aegiribacteria sp. MLS_C]
MSITELSIGAELRSPLLRIRAGTGSYSGSATVQEDYHTTPVTNPESWRTDFSGGSGWHCGIGIAETIVDGTMEAGSHSLNWAPGSGISSGVYFIRLTTEGGTLTQQAMVIR